MPPQLDLSRTSHSKMMASPRINLRRAVSYNALDRDAQPPPSATSSRFNFNHLIWSPPPSPGLPALAPRFKKSSYSASGSRRMLRWGIRTLAWLACFSTALIIYLTYSGKGIPALRWKYHYTLDSVDLVGRNEVPHFPTPIMVTDKRGRPHWTVSIPPNYEFPLSISEYEEVCAKSREVAGVVGNLQHQSLGAAQIRLGFGQSDPYFADVREAEKAGWLPGPNPQGVPKTRLPLLGEDANRMADLPVCERSMTFVLETPDAGIGRTLMALWMAYGIAQKEGRAFFIDESRWAYGKYIDIFGAPPLQNCRAPPRHEILPCPMQARHLAISATSYDMLTGNGRDLPRNEAGTGSFADPNHEKELFDLARDGYDHLFKLNKADSDYVTSRARDLRAKTKVGGHGLHDGVVVGMHVRRGDRHPAEYQYRASYIPSNTYMEQAHDLINATLGTRGDAEAKDRSVVVMASDDPQAYEFDDFVGTIRAQEQIRLASRPGLREDRDHREINRNVMHKFVDEGFGWEGGFFAAMFWNLGLPPNTSSDVNGAGHHLRDDPAIIEGLLRLRGLLARAYMMDLAVLGAASDNIICTVSAMGCRLLAVMMGWDRAFTQGHWINIDGDFDWTGGLS